MIDDGRPRVVITGFSVFPGAPVNPTEALVRHLEATPILLDQRAAYHFEVFEVDYRGLAARLASIGERFQPDIALHFGLSGVAKGFQIETLARNAVGLDKPDQTGHRPLERTIGSGDLPARLPVEAIEDALSRKDIPAARSDDAGDYLCNYLFYLSCAGHCTGFAPPMAGFIHVPLTREKRSIFGTGTGLSFAELVEGTVAIVDACVTDWRAQHRL